MGAEAMVCPLGDMIQLFICPLAICMRQDWRGNLSLWRILKNSQIHLVNNIHVTRDFELNII